VLGRRHQASPWSAPVGLGRLVAWRRGYSPDLVMITDGPSRPAGERLVSGGTVA